MTTEATKTVDPSTDTQEPGSPVLARSLGAGCPHCGSTAKHGERIGCCSGCKTLFSSMSAFDRHRRNLECLDPHEVGLVARTLKQDAAIPAWSWPAGSYQMGAEDE